MKLFELRNQCPSCEHNQSTSIIKFRWDDKIIRLLFEHRKYPINSINEGRFELMECNKCNLIYQLYAPNEEFSYRLYNEWIFNKKNINIDEYCFNPSNEEKIKSSISEINQLLKCSQKKASDIKVLDFGCGWGNWCQAARSMGLEVYGTEINKKQIQYCNKIGIKIISWDEILNYSFDIINIEQVLEHVSNPALIIKHLSEALSLDGILKVGVPDGTHIKRTLKKNFQAMWFFEKKVMKKSLNPVEPLQHLNAFNFLSLNHLMLKNGLKHLRKPLGSFHLNSINTFNFKNIIFFFARSLLPTDYKTTLIFHK